MTQNPDDRTLGELRDLLREHNPLIFDGLETGVTATEQLIAFEVERVAALSDPPGDPPVTPEEYRRAGLRELGRIRSLPLDPPDLPMRRYRFVVQECDVDRPGVVLRTDVREVELDADADPLAWAGEAWPSPRWRVKLDA
jgi:hypothetical protein